MVETEKNDALKAEGEYRTAVEEAHDYIENFDILETITNVGNDEVFTPRKTVERMLDSLPEEVWHNPNYKWLNPSSKNGVFEREIALRLDEGLKEIIPNTENRRKHILQNMIYSLGQTRFTANVARRTLYYCSEANRKCDGLKAKDGHYVNGYAIGNGTWFSDSEGNVKTPCGEHEFKNGSGKRMPADCAGKERTKYKCDFCGINGNSDYNDRNQRENYAYEFIHVDHLVLKKWASKRFFKGDKNMKFDIIIGNPPYQLSDGGAQASARPIYNLFVEQAKALNPKYLCMIIPSRWMTNGKGLDSFRDAMLSDRDIVLLHDYVDPKECFPSNDIKGGVCYFLRVANSNKKCKIVTHKPGEKPSFSTRFLKEEGVNVFVRDERLLPLIKKSLAYDGGSFSKIVSPRKPYGLSGDIFKGTEKYALPPLSDTPIANGIVIHGLNEHLKRCVKYVQADYPFPRKDYLRGWKLFVARNQGSGLFGETLSDAIIASDNEACTETYVVIGPFDTKDEAENCWAYMKTKFFRAMLGIKKMDQGCSQKAYMYVPLVDFHKKWTDSDLYSFFELSQEDVDFIENNVQGMK